MPTGPAFTLKIDQRSPIVCLHPGSVYSLCRIVGVGQAIRRRKEWRGDLDDVPSILSSVAELAASHTGRETEVADGDLFVDELIGKVVGSFGHGSHKDTDALLVIQLLDVFSDSDQWGIETEGDLAAVGREVVGDGVGDDLEKFLLGVDGADGESVKELHH